jgi:hypothetical protein
MRVSRRLSPERKRNYSTVVSFAALVISLPLPLLTASMFPEQVGTFGYRFGAMVHVWLVFWVAAWTLAGFIAGVRGLWLSFHDCGSRWLASVATGANLFLLAQTAKGLRLLF